MEQDPLPKDPARADVSGEKSAAISDPLTELTEESIAQIPVMVAESSDEPEVSILIGLDLLQVISFHGFICCLFFKFRRHHLKPLLQPHLLLLLEPTNCGTSKK